MGTVHMFMHSKGGVGKTTLCYMITQYLQDKNIPFFSYDCDPNNKTLSSYKGLPVQYLELTHPDSNRVNERSFDALMEAIFKMPENAHMLVDVGSNTYDTLLDYMMGQNIPEVIAEQTGHNMCLHSIITGSDFERSVQTLGHLISRVMTHSNCKTIVWLNAFNGAVIDKKNNKTFEDTKIFKDNIDRIHEIALFPQMKGDTFLRDFQDVLIGRKLTFAEAEKDEALHTMVRIRVGKMRKDIYQELERINVFDISAQELVPELVESGKKSSKK